MGANNLLKRLNADEIDNLTVVYHDYGGRACAKTIPRERFESVIQHGVVFARANLNFQFDDHQSAGATFLADTGDFLAVPDPSSYARVPYQESTARVHAFMRSDDGSPWDGCPRHRLQMVVDEFAQEGLSVRVGLEPEFYIFEPSGDGDYLPADRDGMFTLAGLDRHYPLWKSVTDDLREMDVDVEQFGKEYGPAQYEGSPRYGSPVASVDGYLVFKDVVKNRARAAGYLASFMPKPYAHLPGCGLHAHVSLWDLDGNRELSAGERESEPLSEIGGQFVAGLLAHASGLTGLGSPVVNSYKRLLPGSWAPAHVCWGVGNRSALVRVPGLGRRRHLEYRSGDNAMNPFLFVTALLAAGFEGIRQRLTPPPPVDVDVGHLSPAEVESRGLTMLPTSLRQALDAFEADETLIGAIGPVISPEFVKVKRGELAAYDLAVHPWERVMYLESV